MRAGRILVKPKTVGGAFSSLEYDFEPAREMGLEVIEEDEFNELVGVRVHDEDK